MAKKEYLDYPGLIKYDELLKDYIDDHGSSGEDNVIEIVKQNGTALPVTNKAVDVTVPTKVSELTNDSGFVTTDEKVAQSNTTTNADYRILLSGSADDTDHTEGANKNSMFTVNPSTGAVTFGTRAAGSTVGEKSFAQGNNIFASGSYSHAEGSGTTASGNSTHAEGGGTQALGDYSHAEGYYTTASGSRAHAEGLQSIANGFYSHAEGNHTTATHRSQHVFGEYNLTDSSTASASEHGTYVEIVGNGISDARSNARTLDWDGNQYIAGIQTDKNGLQTTKSLTQAEYDALTPAQKSDGTVYYITDAISTEESELWSRVGRGTLHTDAQVISNAINELKGVVGSGDLDTTSQELIGAVNEINSDLTTKQNKAWTTIFSGTFTTDLSLNVAKNINLQQSIFNYTELCIYLDVANYSSTFYIPRPRFTTENKVFNIYFSNSYIYSLQVYFSTGTTGRLVCTYQVGWNNDSVKKVEIYAR